MGGLLARGCLTVVLGGGTCLVMWGYLYAGAPEVVEGCLR